MNATHWDNLLAGYFSLGVPYDEMDPAYKNASIDYGTSFDQNVIYDIKSPS